MSIKISIIHPSFNRSKLCAEAFKRVFSTAKNPLDIEYFVAMDSIDESVIDYYNEFSKVKEINKIGKFEINIGPSTTVMQAVNRVATVISNTTELIVLSTDDMYFPQNWDESLYSLLNGIDNFKEPKFILVSEGHYHKPEDFGKDYMIEHEYGYYIVNAAFYNKLGYIFWPEYSHYGADTDIFAVAKIMNCIIDARNILIKHEYYQQNHSIYDTTYSRKNVDSEWQTSFRVLGERKSRNFDL